MGLWLHNKQGMADFQNHRKLRFFMAFHIFHGFTMLYYALVPPKAACFHGFLIFALPASSRPRKRQIRSKSSKVGERLAAGSSQVWRRSSRTFSTGSCEENSVETWSIP
jgi:hypothetical protein